MIYEFYAVFLFVFFRETPKTLTEIVQVLVFVPNVASTVTQFNEICQHCWYANLRFRQHILKLRFTKELCQLCTRHFQPTQPFSFIKTHSTLFSAYPSLS